MGRRSPVLFAALAAALVVFPLRARAGEDAPAAPRGGVVFEPGPPPFADLLAQAKQEGKLVFLDFSTEWCGWCKKLDEDTFSQASVAQAMKGFLAVHLDAEKGEGVALAQRFGAHGFPTLVVVDAEGREVDRIVGYLPPEPFVKEIARIARGEGTLPALRQRFAEHPEDLALALDLAEKLSGSDGEAALALAVDVEGKAAGQPALAARALGVQLDLHQGARRMDRVKAVAEALVAKYPEDPAAEDAFEVLVYAQFAPTGPGQEPDVAPALATILALRARVKDGRLPASVERLDAQFHRMAAEQSLVRSVAAAGEDAQALNEAAWTVFLLKGDLERAQGWAEKAVAWSQRDPMILDTLANILAEMGRLDEAIVLETEAAEKLGEGAEGAGFLENVAKWRAVAAFRKATGREVVPAARAVPTTVPEAPEAPEGGGAACGGGK